MGFYCFGMAVQKMFVDGVEIYFSEFGRGQPLIFLHGFPTDFGTLVENAFLLKLSERFRVIVPNLPGFGMSGKIRSADLKGYVFFLSEFLYRLRLSNVILAGYSFGGLISLKYASTYPYQVGKLALIGTNLKYRFRSSMSDIASALTRFYMRYRSELIDDFLTRNLVENSRLAKWIWKKLAGESTLIDTKVYPQFRKMPISVSIGVLDTLLNLDLTSDAPMIRAPTLIINGKRDPLADENAGKRLRSLIKRSELILNDEEHCCLINNDAMVRAERFFLGG